MSFLSKIGDFLTGGLGNKIAETVKEYFPPDLTPQQKAKIQAGIRKSTQQHEQELKRLAIEADEVQLQKQKEFNERIEKMEGTASDLTQFGWLGRIVLFLRGMQRPFWGFATFYLDARWMFSVEEFSERQELALVLINVLVLTFLFGERAIKNIAPLIARIMESRKS